MGLTLQALKSLKPYLKGKVLSLGYQDILATNEEVKSLFGIEVEKTTDYGRRHNVSHPLPETEEFFQKIGCEHVCVDIVKARGTEIICDLNLPPQIEALSPKQYDLVLDGGTLEHCFNVGQAFMTVADTVKLGGVIFHGNPISMINHGFYNFSPTLYHDFYTQNGWEVELMMVSSKNGDTASIPPTDRCRVGQELSILVAARRISDALKFPTQTKYL
jgi:hypothetical protein